MTHECWRGRILWVDLSSQKTWVEELKQEVYERFIGGKGLGAYLLYTNLKSGIDPLSSDNILIFLSGPLQGLPAPNVGRWTLVTKSPLTGLFLDTHCGHALGREIKKSGFDALCVIGKSSTPIALVIEDESVIFEDASNLWGKGVYETTELLHAKFSKTHIVYTIGQAGENLCRIATACCEIAHQTGRGGAGAVLGSKNLKAVISKGSGSIHSASPDVIRKMNSQLSSEWKEKDTPFKRYGTPFLVEPANELGMYPTRNWQSGFFEQHMELDIEVMEEKWGLGSHQSCPHCVMRCTRAYKTRNPSDSTQEVEATIEYETIGLLGGNIGVSDPQIVFKLTYLCDDYGLDTISTGTVIGFAMEAFERGLITADDVGFQLNFGDGEAAIKLLKLIGNREGFGDVLADGVKAAALKIGKGSMEFAVHVKGLEVAAWDPRGRKGLGLSYATAEVGASHLRGWPSPYSKPTESALDVVESMINARYEKHLTDSLIVCHFTYHLPLGLEQKTALLNAATGLEYDESSIRRFGQRVETLTRLFNYREGATRKDDALPKRFWEPEKSGPAEGLISFISQEDFEASLDAYYEKQGWDKDGKPKKETISLLDLDGVL